MKPKALKERFRSAATWVVYIPKYNVSINVAHFSKIYYHTSLQDGNRHAYLKSSHACHVRDTKPTKCTNLFVRYLYEGWNFNSGNYLFTTDTK